MCPKANQLGIWAGEAGHPPWNHTLPVTCSKARSVSLHGENSERQPSPRFGADPAIGHTIGQRYAQQLR